MATAAFICDMGNSEKSVRSLQLKQRGCSYTLLQVLVGVLAVLVLAMTGGIIWMKMSQVIRLGPVFIVLGKALSVKYVRYTLDKE